MLQGTITVRSCGAIVAMSYFNSVKLLPLVNPSTPPYITGISDQDYLTLKTRCNRSGPCASCVALGPDKRGLARGTISAANSNDQSKRKQHSERRDFVGKSSFLRLFCGSYLLFNL